MEVRGPFSKSLSDFLDSNLEEFTILKPTTLYLEDLEDLEDQEEDEEDEEAPNYDHD